MKRSRKQIGYVYFVREVGAEKIKIGYTSSLPTFRVTKLAVECGSPLQIAGLLIGSAKRERELHREFADLNIEGEWFRCDERLEQFIEGIEYDKQDGLQTMIGLQFDDQGRMSRGDVKGKGLVSDL